MPIFEIKSPDGKTYEVTGPEGSTKEQALEKVKAQHSTSPPPPESSTLSDVAKSAGTGIAKGAIAAVGLPGDAGNLLAKGSKVASDYIAGKFGLDKGPEPSAPVLPTSEGIQKRVEGVTGEFHKPETTAGRYAETVGEFSGNPLSYVGSGSLLVKGGAAALSGVGSEAAGQSVEGLGSPALEAGARMVGGLAGAAGATASAERNLTKLAEQLPTPEKIKAAATAGYDMLKASNTRISQQGTQDLLASVKNDLHADNFRDYLAPSTYRAIEELGSTGSATIGDLDGVRKLLNRVPATNPTDREAARRAIQAIDDYIANVPTQHIISGDPARDAAILKHAQGNWALHKQLEQLDEASIKGQHRAGVSGSGVNSINTARQEVRKILDSDKKSRGMSDAVKDKMEEIVMGTWLTNQARQVGKFAPSGPVSATSSILTGMAGGPMAGAAVAGTGFLAKYLGEYLTDKQIRELEQLMRAASPIGKPIAQAIAPQVAEQRAVPAAALTRSVLSSPLAAGGP
jgi:hypothetical protein